MRLNLDCVRDILIAVEEATDYFQPFEYIVGANTHERLEMYTHDEIAYHIRQCALSGYFYCPDIMGNSAMIRITDLSPAGHEFLAKIRSDTIWSKTKDVAASIGAKSLDVVAQVAVAVLTETIRSKFSAT